MGKRKREQDYDYIARKIKKLEKKLNRKKRHRSRSSSREHDSEHLQDYVEDASGEPDLEILDPIPSTSVSAAQPSITTDIQQLTVPMSTVTQPLPNKNTDETLLDITDVGQVPTVLELRPEILNIFGEDPSAVPLNNKEIQGDLAVRLQHVTTKGLTNETRKELMEKYLPPKNCPLIDAPSLNPEIKAALTEIILKRDKGIEIKQKQSSCAISSLSEAINIMINKEDVDTEGIKLLMDPIRLICDNQHSDSVVRRNFILHSLKKEMKEQIQKTVIDKQLFGSDLAENLKLAKSITKTGAELKQSAPSTFTRNAPAVGAKPTLNQQSTLQQRNNLNWRPPPSRRQTGTQRTREPAPRNPPANYSRGSYRSRPPQPPPQPARANTRNRR